MISSDTMLATEIVGNRWIDTISGNSGTATGVAYYLNGTTSVQIEGTDHNGVRRTEWFDIERLEEVSDAADGDGVFL